MTAAIRSAHTTATHDALTTATGDAFTTAIRDARSATNDSAIREHCFASKKPQRSLAQSPASTTGPLRQHCIGASARPGRH